jgi:NAD(P)H-dependent flavin oxidoreductase YrpB (nitropropane dioxygenase family)
VTTLDKENRKDARMWPDRRIVDLFKIEHPILLGPMASAVDFALAIANGGGLGAIPCAMLTAEQCANSWGNTAQPPKSQ